MSLAEEKQKIRKKQKQVESQIYFASETIKKAKRHNNKIIPSCENIFLDFQKREILEQRLAYLENFEDEASTYPIEMIIPIIKQLIMITEGRKFDDYFFEIDDGIYSFGLVDANLKNDNSDFIFADDEIIVLGTTASKENILINLNELVKNMNDNSHFLYLKKFVDLIINTCYCSQKEKLNAEELTSLANDYCEEKKRKRLVRE